MLFLRSLLAAIALPGTVTVFVPWLILARRGMPAPGGRGPLRLVGAAAIAAGAAVLLRCIREFAVVGRGTLAPVDPPKTLVVEGLYRYVRNPMYVGVMTVLLGEAAAFVSRALLAYAAAVLAAFHLFVVLYEEPALRRRFGASYERYCARVGRWVPGRPFDADPAP